MDVITHWIPNQRSNIVRVRSPLCSQIEQTSAYGLKQGSYNWYQKLKTSLVDRNFKASKIDPCLYIGNGMIILMCVDNCTIVGPSMDKLDAFIESMQVGPERMYTDRRRRYRQILWD